MKQRLFYFGVLLLVLVASGIFTAVAQPAPDEDMIGTQIDFNTVQMSSASFGLDWNVAAGGGSTITSSHYRLSSTIGQPVIGNFSSPSFAHHAGYWQQWVYRLFLPAAQRN